MRITFKYLLNIKVVVVNTELLDPFDNMPSSFITSELFPGDEGVLSPNPSTNYLEEGYFHIKRVALNLTHRKPAVLLTSGYI